MAPRLLIALALVGCGGGRREEAVEPEPDRIENIVAGDVVIEPCAERDGLLARLEACPTYQVRLRLLERRVDHLKGVDPPSCADEAAELRKLAVDFGCL